MIQLSLIIPCSRPEHCFRLLESIDRYALSEKIEVIVCGTIEKKLTDHPWNSNVCFIESPDSHVNRKRNLAIEKSQGLYLAFLDDDTEVTETWLLACLDHIEQLPHFVLTGPEIPLNEGSLSQLVYSVSFSYWAEFSNCHVNFKHEQVRWADVPFCNCMVPRELLTSPLSEEIPWDMDDFHFFQSLKDKTAFFNSPIMMIKHDRYPNSIWKYLKYKWKGRTRTGEKYVSHFSLYSKVPTITLAALAPFLAAASFYFFGWRPPLLTPLALYSLVLVLFIISTKAFSQRHLLKRLLVLAGLHLSTFIGMQWGILRGLTGRGR